MIPPRVRRQQVVVVHPHERQLRPTIEAGMSSEMVSGMRLMGRLRVERIRRYGRGQGEGDDETKPLSELPDDESLRGDCFLGLTGGVGGAIFGLTIDMDLTIDECSFFRTILENFGDGASAGERRWDIRFVSTLRRELR